MTIERQVGAASSKDSLPSQEQEKVSFLTSLGDEYRLLPSPLRIDEMGMQWFQERELLKPLMVCFNGDVEEMFRRAFDQHVRVSGFGESQNLDDFAVDFVELEESERRIANEISSTIMINSGRQSEKYIERTKITRRLYGKGHKKNSKWDRRYTNNVTQLQVQRARSLRKGEEWLTTSTLSDTKEVIQTFVEQMDEVCYLTSRPRDVYVPALIISQTQGGKLYYPGISGTESQIFSGFQEMMINMEDLKGYEPGHKARQKIDKREKLTGFKGIPRNIRFQMEEFFSRDYYRAGWYKDGSLNQFDELRMVEFLLYWNIAPMKSSPKSVMRSLEPHSLDAIVLYDFYNTPNEELPALLSLASKSLKDNGKIIIYETDALRQAWVEQSENILEEARFARVEDKPLSHPAIWRIYVRDMVSVQSAEDIDNGVSVEQQPKKSEDVDLEVKTGATEVLARRLAQKQDNFTVRDIAQTAGVSASDVRKRLKSLGFDTQSLNRRKKTRGRKAKLIFTAYETAVIIHGLED